MNTSSTRLNFGTRQRRAVPAIGGQQSLAESAHLTALSPQRVYGNQALGRIARFAQPRLGVSTIQRIPGDDPPLLQLTDRPWAQVEMEEKLKKPGPLMLTDRPWSEIEKEKDPVRKLLYGDEKKKPQERVTLEMEEAPLMLTDKPWEEIVKEREYSRNPKAFVSDFEERYRAMSGDYRMEEGLKARMSALFDAYLKNAKAKKRLSNPETRKTADDLLTGIESDYAKAKKHEKSQRKNRRDKLRREQERTKHKGSYEQKLSEMKALPGGSKYTKDLSKIEEKHFKSTFFLNNLGSEQYRTELDSELDVTRVKHKAKIKRNQTLEQLNTRRDLFAKAKDNADSQLNSSASNKQLNDRLTYFDSTVEPRKGLEDKLQVLQLLSQDLDKRLTSITQLVSDIMKKDSTSANVNHAIETMTQTGDNELLKTDSKVSDVRMAQVEALKKENLKTAREAMIDGMKLAPHKMNNVLVTWLKNKVLKNTDLKKNDYLIELIGHLDKQYNLTGSAWMTKSLGYQRIVRPGIATLYLRDVGSIALNNKNGGGTTNYHVHVSVFSDTIADSQINCNQTIDQIVNSLFASSNDPMEASHATLELYAHNAWPPGGNPNPHVYRGTAPSRRKRLFDKTNDAWPGVRTQLDNKLTAELLRVRTPVNTVITNKGLPDFPDPAGLK